MAVRCQSTDTELAHVLLFQFLDDYVPLACANVSWLFTKRWTSTAMGGALWHGAAFVTAARRRHRVVSDV